MTWLLAVALRPFAAAVFFGISAALAFAIRPLIPDGQWKRLLYDRTFRNRRPVLFTLFILVGVYGTVFAVYLIVS